MVEKNVKLMQNRKSLYTYLLTHPTFTRWGSYVIITDRAVIFLWRQLHTHSKLETKMLHNILNKCVLIYGNLHIKSIQANLTRRDSFCAHTHGKELWSGLVFFAIQTVGFYLKWHPASDVMLKILNEQRWNSLYIFVFQNQVGSITAFSPLIF